MRCPGWCVFAGMRRLALFVTLIMAVYGGWAGAASADDAPCQQFVVPHPDGGPPMIFTVCP